MNAKTLTALQALLSSKGKALLCAALFTCALHIQRQAPVCFLLELCVLYTMHVMLHRVLPYRALGVAQTCEAPYLAVHQCRRLLESSTAAPPSLNRQLGMVMLR